ncbi:hypothetical protein Gohar_002474, partial [Gossypium harknessii]|nr:hypothetical protein [Gossypium harknessii]
IKAPRLLQSIFSAVGDLYLYKLSFALFGDGVAKWALFSQLANWFMFFCFNRTFSNSLETTLTLVGLYYWPSVRSSLNKAPSGSRKWGLALAALACAIRPTSAVTWVYVGLLELYSTHDRLRFIFVELIPIGFVLPVLPISLIFAGYSLAALEERGSRNGEKKRSSCICNKWPSRKQLAIFFLLASNIPMALYMSLIHQ